ncbi:hypothetical protein NQ315_011590 [Exocentrus adspersus]|uniref:Peptidase S1 domain-containing protein n=1 Tax=Exocentrus adspersus TaxID=1586481 RepID=A0AAV8VUV5_9CUCU|nr:hypothetical protein NQ315_011590 [Exocentrus adspersus]
MEHLFPILLIGVLGLDAVECGIGNVDTRIIGGNVTTIDKHPWQVSLQVFQNHVCGGVIISSDTVLTAAHCITELLITSYYVVPGVTKLTQAAQKIQIQEIIIHNDFDGTTYDYDIAILKLQDRLTFSENIKSISLPEEAHSVIEGTRLMTSGWGITHPEESCSESDTLREVEIQFINWDKCKKQLSSADLLTDRMICAGVPEGGKDTCQCDSGGALELNGTLIGIVSWGDGCGEPGHPGVYTHVSYLRPWIKQQAGI